MTIFKINGQITEVTNENKANRISPQISCTITQEDKEKLDFLQITLSVQCNECLNTSQVIRALIKYGYKNLSELKSLLKDE